MNTTIDKCPTYCSNLDQVVLTWWGNTWIVMANCAFHIITKMLNPERMRGPLEGQGQRVKAVIPSITTTKGNTWGP